MSAAAGSGITTNESNKLMKIEMKMVTVLRLCRRRRW